MGLAIVAIPEEQDRVWEISSEKVPHLTLLFLGDEASADTQQIMQFVQHATEMTEHGPFYLDVDRRDTLGADDADVVFFNKRSWNLRWIKQFRGQLLQNDAVRTAYDSTEQFPEWQPHLTLGYPETPAKKPNDDRGDYLYSVAFDRIAVWAGDYEGPEFRLEWPDREEFDGPLGVAWADAQKAALEHYAMMDPNGELEHYGVKGMHWGERKSADTGGGGSSGGEKTKSATAEKGKSALKGLGNVVKETAKFAGDVQFENMARDGRAREGIEIDATNAFHRTDLPAIKSKPEYTAAKKLTHRLRRPGDPMTKQYRNEVKSTYIKRLEEAANNRTNVSGTRQYTIRERGWELPAQGGNLPKSKWAWEVSSRDIQHADSSKPFFIEAVLDDDGFVTDLRPIEPSTPAVHTVADVGEQFIIEHYGIKGMRWGFRRSTPEASTPVATSRVPHGNRRKTKIETEGGQNHPAHPDAIGVAQAKVKLKKSGPAALSNKELQDVANRVQLEERVKLLTSSKGSKFVKNELENEGKNIAKAGAKKAAKAGARAGAKKAATALLV